VTDIPTIDAATDAAIRQLIARYCWALDTADLPALGGLFTPDCVFQDTSGKRYEGRPAALAYFTWLTALPSFRGRRHHIDNLVYVAIGGDCRTKSYWLVEKWEAASERKLIDFVGWSSDRFVLQGGQWRFAERILHYWRDSDGPWVAGPVEA